MEKDASHAHVALRGVTKTYEEGQRRRAIFRDLHAHFARGEFAALMGRSGTGKTTLLNLISGIDLPDSGEVALDGTVLNRLPDRDRTLYRRRGIGFVFQFFNLIPTLTVEENLLLPLELLAWPGGAARERVRAMLARVALEEREKAFPDRLSGGEQQRIAIARALVHEPSLVLADEPTGNLDADTGREVLALLAGLTRDGDKTLILVTHSAEAAALAERVLAIEDGQLLTRHTAPARGNRSA
ncbi:MAG: ABC transporter ATP-binding protein [Gammaproteobacteria bacterium]|nr:ABC transporter ATP-binding protein [Gammaproteobacteria bacterium]NIR83603.1 ABC transporter ATP-binding protein [Gammaproteobacteria bacterium]NIR91576.1 ABC transporter ATP-binding protein [Gammaproteobacteria bacterium]NIU04765.1 ABC transporter ATP-binding protein [Gammaproteobacteria bacterium]NIV53115.1 ATP-binding cassette domain-containing protein [Gammaproteobacteria bacterium]